MAVIPRPPQLPGHRDLAPLGRGGYSEVYRAYQEQFDRWVAVKVLTFTLTDERSQRRFLRECRLAGRLSSHPNIATVYDAGITPDGRPYIAMELFPEGSISDALRSRGPFDVAEALRVGIALAGALETAHRAGVVHRDVKPANVLLTSYRQPVLTDFGLSIVSERHEVSVGSDALTPYHAAPEVLERTSIAPTSDVYSLASTVYAMLAGRAAHQSETQDSIASLLLRILQKDVPPLARPDLPPSLSGTLQLALARDPAVRTPSALAFALALQDAQRELGVEVTEPVLMDIPASSVETPFDPPSPSPSPSPGSPASSPPSPGWREDPASPETSQPWGLAPAPLWSPADRPSARSSPAGSPGPDQVVPGPHDPVSPSWPEGGGQLGVAGTPVPPMPGGAPVPPRVDAPGPGVTGGPSSDPARSAQGWGQPPTPRSGSADVTIQRARLQDPVPADPDAEPSPPPPVGTSGSDRSWMLAGPGAPPAGVDDPTAAAHPAPPETMPGPPGSGAPAGAGFAGGPAAGLPALYEPGVEGERTMHRDQLRSVARPAPLTVPDVERSRWVTVAAVGGALLGVGAIAGAAVLLLGGDDGGGGGRRDRRDEAGAEVDVPQGLQVSESTAGVQLDWEGSEEEAYLVLVLSENERPALVSADGPSALIPATDLRPDLGYCFAVARARDVGDAPSGQAEEAFSPPSCIRGAAEDTVIQE